MSCVTQTEVCFHLPFSLALYLSGMALGSPPSSRICRGHWVTRLTLYYEVETRGMVLVLILYMGTTSLGKMQGLAVPPPPQRQGASHDGTSTSGIHLSDTDDDNEEYTEDG
ncbi:unnamed protein product [Lactuca saligna]|uniref:Uncharacterized protein n=1 Tax=Lactuca saligna TaxID=75948 RepID=A0AA35Z593_LACSI|nr:unnamed protein product [Lactuca saligna]